MEKYFNKTHLNFFTYPEDKMVYDLTLEEVKVILDFISFELNKIKVITGITDLKTILMSPFNCLVVETDEYIVFGVSNDNCVLNLNMLLCSKNIYANQNVESVIRKATINELGFETNHFIWVKKDVIYENKMLLSKIADFDEYIEKTKEIYNGQNGDFVTEITRCSAQFFEKLIEEENILNINPVFKARNLTIDEKLCFCVLPFDDERLEIFNDIIKPELEKDFGLTIIRADNIFSNNDIMEDIWTYICKSRFVIADVSLKNPNVFYELGICHTIGKEVITICDESSLQDDYNGKLPFDIQSRRTIFYKNSGSGPNKMVEDLKNTVRSIIDGKTVLI